MNNATVSRARRSVPWAAAPGGSAVLALLLVASLSLSACGPARAVVAACRSTDRFVSLNTDPRILYEPGAASFALAAAPLFDAAVAAVETGHGAPFSQPVTLYLCESEASFTRFSGSKGKGAVTTKLFLSPALLHQPETISFYLTHELSHLHMQQRIGVRGMLRLPVWYKEGLATLVSCGGGALDVSDGQAESAMRAGRAFQPDAGGSILTGLFFPQYAATFHLENQMFYRQAMLFTRFLQTTDAQAFQMLLSAVESGQTFPGAFTAAYGSPLPALWQRFQKVVLTQAGTDHAVENFQEGG